MERKARRIGTIAGRTSENHQLFGMKSNITDAKIAMGQSCKCVSNARGGWGGGGEGKRGNELQSDFDWCCNLTGDNLDQRLCIGHYVGYITMVTGGQRICSRLRLVVVY